VYDRHTNSLVRLEEDEYAELAQVEKGELSAEDSQVVGKYQEQGLFVPNVVEKIEHPGTAIIESYVNTRMEQLILQVTQQCNLRCGYCVYSGIYGRNRVHSNERMSWDTAKKAIDFFLKRSWAIPESTIGFYGGEPLLEFGLIKQCVDYVKTQVEGKTIVFNITTNGTIMTDEMMEFMVANDFMLTISLDGSKEEHDVNRKFSDGEGSFDVIIKNIKKFKNRYPSFDENISIITTINPYMDLDCVLEYFNTTEIFNDKNIIFNTVNEVNLSQSIDYDKKYHEVRSFEYVKMLFALVGKLDEKYVSPLTLRIRGSIEARFKDVQGRVDISSIAHHGGPCMPGVMRLFVRTDGVLFPCERVGDVLDYFAIGTLEDGLDINKIKALLNNGVLTENECEICWSIRQCTICSAQLNFDIEPTKKEKLEECAISVKRVLTDMYEISVLSEFGLVK